MALEPSDKIAPIYCYCGAGFYKGMWEEILQQPVEVELLENALKCDEAHEVAIHLPDADPGEGSMVLSCLLGQTSEARVRGGLRQVSALGMLCTTTPATLAGGANTIS